MVFSQTPRVYPGDQRHSSPSQEWKQFHFDWKDFDGLDGTGTLAFSSGAAELQPGPFELEIDDVRLTRRRNDQPRNAES